MTCPDCRGELNEHALRCGECDTRYCNRCYAWHECPAHNKRQPADELAHAKRVLNRDLRAVLGGWARKLT